MDWLVEPGLNGTCAAFMYCVACLLAAIIDCTIQENYLIGMLNAGVLALYVRGSGPVLGRRFMLAKTLEWNLYLCILDPMFDEHFHIRQEFLADESKLRRRLMAAAAVNALLSPFLLLFLVIYFFMKHAERFYHSPGNLGSRRWSSLAKWRLRELNELPHYIQHRLDASYESAVKYVGQFPSPMVSQVAKFVSFVAGSFAALLLGLSLLDENLLEVPLGGRNVVWWLALTGILLTISRSLVNDTPVAFDPERAMAELVLHTHYLPRHWRGRAHSSEVQQAMNSLFTYKLLLFLEELASVVLTPFILAYSLPRCAGAIQSFVAETTTRVEGVGDVCSLAVFDFDRHGNSKYGAPIHAAKKLRSKQGKMEKSFLTFVATYPTWHPSPAGRQLLHALAGAASMTGNHRLATMAAAQPPGGRPEQACAVGPAPGGAGSGTAGGCGGSVWWQQPGSSAAAAGAAGAAANAAVDGSMMDMMTPRLPQQSGTSSIWVGVPEQPTTLRHPNHQQRWRQQQLEQQPLLPAEVEQDVGLGDVAVVTPAGAAPAEWNARHLRGHLDILNCQQQKQQQMQSQQSQDVLWENSCAAGAATGQPSALDDLLIDDELQFGAVAENLFGALSPAGQRLGITKEPRQLGIVTNHQAVTAAAAAAAAVVTGKTTSPAALPAPAATLGHCLQPSVCGPAVANQSRHDHHQHKGQQPRQQSLRQPPPPQQQQQQHLQYSTMLPGVGMLLAPTPQALQLYPSTLYPGGPSAATALSQQLLHAQQGAMDCSKLSPAQHLQAQTAQHNTAVALSALGASMLAANTSSTAGSDFLPTNETDDLSSRVAASQSLMQSFYESQDVTVQHRQHNRAHARSVLLGNAGNAAAAAAAVAAMAAGSASHHAVPSGEW